MWIAKLLRFFGIANYFPIFLYFCLVMDVEFLSGMISELMLDHDCLSLPGLGTFVAEDMPASFSDRGYTINPPYRRLSFSERETRDNLLADLYAGANPQAPEEAKAVLKAYLNDLREELTKEKSVDLPGLGRLRATRENHFFFVADENLDIFPEACGLEAVSLKTHAVSEEFWGQNGMVLHPNEPETVDPGAIPTPSAPDNLVQPADQPAQPATHPAQPARKRLAKPWRWAISTVAAAAALLLAFVALSRLAPDFTDKLLYTQEELEIINYPEDGLGLPR